MESTKPIISKEDIKKILDVEKLKYCFECGICTASCSVAELLGKNYNPRALLERIYLNPDTVLSSDELWLCAWCYNCHKRCPQALRVPEIFLFFRTIAAERGYTQPFESALEKIVENIPLPLVTALVCFHPERAGLDKDKILDRIEQKRKEFLKKGKKKKAAKAIGDKVAVIGSGPAGLTVAHEVTHKGYKVTIFEALSEAGGMLRKCIPEYRLPKQVLEKEIQFLRDLGVEIETSIQIGKDVSFGDLWKQGYKAIFIGVGAHKSQNLRIEGGDLQGVMYALDFLWKVNFGEKLEVGKNVVLIGGGNVAVDAARTALQLGARDVTILYRRSREEMPANPWEVKEAENEDIKIEFLVAPKKIMGENGRVSTVECVRMQLGEPDETGRKKPIPIEGSEFMQQADTVIFAVGETSDLAFLPKEVELNEDGTIWTDPTTMETSMRGVFAGGDVATGPASIIEAIRAGKLAAESIDDYLKSSGG